MTVNVASLNNGPYDAKKFHSFILPITGLRLRIVSVRGKCRDDYFTIFVLRRARFFLEGYNRRRARVQKAKCWHEAFQVAFCRRRAIERILEFGKALFVPR